MTLEDAYRMLEVRPSASADELKTAHRDLTKVWHPDRFASDASMQRRAEEKLKAINEAYDTIRAAREGRRVHTPPAGPPPPPTVRQQLRRLMTWLLMCVLAGLFILVRRPTPGGLIVAVILFGAAGLIVLRMRALERAGSQRDS